MRPVAALLFSALLALSAIQASHAAWTTYKHDDARTGMLSSGYMWGGRGYVDYRVAWNFSAGLCVASSPVLVDLDGDGVDDVSFASCDGYEYALRGRDGSLLWRVRTGGGLVNPAAWDVDGDGVAEIIVGGSEGMLYCIDGGTGRVEWRAEGYFQRATVAIGDVDGDREAEIVANGLDGRLRVFSLDGELKYSVRLGDEPVGPPAIADVTGDGVGDVVVLEGSYLHVVSLSSSSEPLVRTARLGGEGEGSPALWDVDGDGVAEIVVAAGDKVSLVDFDGGRILWTASLEGAAGSGPSLGDLDGDGRPEILVSTDGSVEIFSLNGTRLAVLEGLEAYRASPIVVDIDGDGEQEAILAEYAGDLAIVSDALAGGAVDWLLDTGAPLMAPPAVGDVDGDGLPEIVFGSRDFHVYCIDGVASQPPPTTSPMPPPVRTSSATRTQGAVSPATGSTGLEVTTGPGSRGFSPNYRVILGLIIGAALVILVAYKYT